MTSTVLNPMVFLLPVIIYLIMSRMDNPVTRWLNKYRSITSLMVGGILLVEFNGHNVWLQIPIIFILIGLFYLYKDYKILFG